MQVSYYVQGIDFVPKEWKVLQQWITDVVNREGRSLGCINYIFCNDEELLALNQKHLGHDTLTDIITFDYADTPGTVEGDLYISIEGVKENAATWQVSFMNELCRVMVHGILHLIGYDDTTPQAKKIMREKEEEYLGRLRLLNEEL